MQLEERGGEHIGIQTQNTQFAGIVLLISEVIPLILFLDWATQEELQWQVKTKTNSSTKKCGGKDQCCLLNGNLL